MIQCTYDCMNASCSKHIYFKISDSLLLLEQVKQLHYLGRMITDGKRDGKEEEPLLSTLFRIKGICSQMNNKYLDIRKSFAEAFV